MIGWKERGRGGSPVNLDGTGAVTTEDDVALPVGAGEWEDPLGLPLCVVCQNVRYLSQNASTLPLTGCSQAERIDLLEKTQSWKEEQFDMVLQYLRTVLLKRASAGHYIAVT
jgi:dynein light intermediate chain 1